MINKRTNFTSTMADIVCSDIQYKKSVWYNFLGKTDGYSYGSVLPEVSNTQYEENSVRSEITFLKKISSEAVSRYCNRYDWEENTVYDKWDHTVDMSNKKFYVVTSHLGFTRVYKCLDNRMGTLSTIKPVFNDLDPVRLADGYLWKYMFQIPDFKMKQFGNFSYIPVQKALSDNFYNKGSIESVIISNPGEGYVDVPLTTISVDDTGVTTGSGAEIAVAKVTLSGGLIGSTLDPLTTGFNIIPGSGYSAGAKIVINSSGGIGAVYEPVFSAGTITAINVITPGFGYSTSDTVSVVLGGAKFLPSVNDSGEIVNVTIEDNGVGYTAAPTLSVVGAGGVGKYGSNPEAIISAVVDSGVVQRVLVEDPGVGYPVDRMTTIIVEGDGHGVNNPTAVIQAVVKDGKLVDTIITDAGTRYTSATLTVTGAGTSAKITPIFSSSDYTSDQVVIEQVAVQGAIYSCNMTDIGTGYTVPENISVVITGDGEGATAVPIVEDGSIKGIIMTTFGKDYSYANVSFVDTQRDNLNPFLVSASGTCTIPPNGGHGYDAPSELFCKGIVVYSSFRDDPDLEYIDQDYRTIGIIKDPKDIYDKNLTSQTELVSYTIKGNTSSTFIKDQILTREEKYRYKILSVKDEDGEFVLMPLGFSTIVPSGELILESDISKSVFVTSILDTPRVDRLTGELIFYKYEQPFKLDETQGMLIKTFISFEDLNNGFQQ